MSQWFSCWWTCSWFLKPMFSYHSPLLWEVLEFTERALEAAPWLKALQTRSRSAGERTAGGRSWHSLTRPGSPALSTKPRKAENDVTRPGYLLLLWGKDTSSLKWCLDKGPPPLILSQLPSWSSLFSKFNSLESWSIFSPQLDPFTVPGNIRRWAMMKKTRLRKVRWILSSPTASH